MGHPEDLAASLHIVQRDGPSIEVSLSSLFLRLLTLSSHFFHPTSPPPAFASHYWDAPLAHPDFSEEVFQASLAKVRASLGALRDTGDSQLETSLLHSCLTLPKISFVLCTCSPRHICHTTVDFDSAIRESVELIMGGHLPDWLWLKASLPSSQGGLNLCSTSLHVPAAFLASRSNSKPLVEQIPGHPSGPPPHICSALLSLASIAIHCDWQSLDDIDAALRQHSLFLSIDDTSFQRLLSSAPSI